MLIHGWLCARDSLWILHVLAHLILMMTSLDSLIWQAQTLKLKRSHTFPMVMLQVSYKAGTQLSRLTSEPRAPALWHSASCIAPHESAVHLLTLDIIHLFNVILALHIGSQNT